jgi:hypothetical protein
LKGNPDALLFVQKVLFGLGVGGIDAGDGRYSAYLQSWIDTVCLLA